MKSHVSMEQHQCIVCGALYDTGSILLDKRLHNSLERFTVTGRGMCPEHQKLKDDGFVALIEADERTRQRTGRVAHVRSAVWDRIFTVDVPEGMVAMVLKDVMDIVESLHTPTED